MKDVGHELYIEVDTKIKTERSFIVCGNFYKIYKKYMDLRPKNFDDSSNLYSYLILMRY